MHAGNRAPLKISLHATCVLQTMENFTAKSRVLPAPFLLLTLHSNEFIPRRSVTIPSTKH